MTKPFSLLVKPASADCNLKCEYCFYLDRCGLYPDTAVHRMKTEVLEKMISSFMETAQPQYSIGWQGGEPTLMGTEFFKSVTDFQQKYGKKGTVVANGIQTNATLIDDEMAEHFAKYNFLCGVSLDGPEEIHDLYRKTKGGTGTHGSVMKSIETLRRHKVEFNILILVSKANVKRARDVYKYLVDNGFYYLQYIPCVEFEKDDSLMPFSITGREWGNFLSETFDRWHHADTRRVSIRFFDSILSLLVDKQRNICHLGSDCRQYFVVEYNGDVYPCDFFVRKEFKLGNIMEHRWDEMQASEAYKVFGLKKRSWNSACDQCQFLRYCQGDCLKHRPDGSAAMPGNLSVLCEGMKIFFRHSLPKFKILAEKIRKEREAAERENRIRPLRS